MDTAKGSPSPLGVTQTEKGLNFSLMSLNATHVLLRLFVPGSELPFAEYPLNQTEGAWHMEVHGLPDRFEYTYRCNGPFDPKKGHFFNPEMDLIDPYAKALSSNEIWGQIHKPHHSVYEKPHFFDWGNSGRPLIPEEDLIIYEMHVRSFTQHPSSKVSAPGTFKGIEEKIPYFKELGVNAIELMPIHEFNETENLKVHPQTKQPLFNYWGYGTEQFFTLMRRFGTGEELKSLVKKLHENGIELFLDVVYNHTSEGNNQNYYYSFRGIDNATYYIMDEYGYCNYTGCGNTLKCQHPIVQDLILDSLRYWVSEFHIDGFRFDLASIMTRDEKGTPLCKPPLIERMTRDPILGPTKLIAEPWDPGGLYQVGSFPSWKFSEWNGKYRDRVRRFIRGAGNLKEMKMSLLGSPDLYGAPLKSINLITVHDGFTLRDLVSYNEKHNMDNGENNQDGANDNESWNCGVEGPTKDPNILALRERQMKNFLVALFVSQGTPLLLMGDEYGHTRGGNNNTWCQDGELNYFLWNELEKQKSLFRFTKKLIQFRQTQPLLKNKKFLSPEDVFWEEDEKRLALTLKDQIFIAFNTSHGTQKIQKNGWLRLVDTALESPEDFLDIPLPISDPYELIPYSSVLFFKPV